MANKGQSKKISQRMQRRAEERRKKRMTTLVVVAVVIVVLAGVLFAVMRNGNNSNNTVQRALPAEISVEEAYQLVEEGAFLLDVRTLEEWNEFHAPQATLIPQDTRQNKYALLQAKKRCANPHRFLFSKTKLFSFAQKPIW